METFKQIEILQRISWQILIKKSHFKPHSIDTFTMFISFYFIFFFTFPSLQLRVTHKYTFQVMFICKSFSFFFFLFGIYNVMISLKYARKIYGFFFCSNDTSIYFSINMRIQYIFFLLNWWLFHLDNRHCDIDVSLCQFTWKKNWSKC